MGEFFGPVLVINLSIIGRIKALFTGKIQIPLGAPFEDHVNPDEDIVGGDA